MTAVPSDRAPQVATRESFELAEGPFWDVPRERVMWVDISRGLALSGTLDEDGTIEPVERVALPGTVGAVAPAESGDWLIAGRDRLHVRGLDGTVVDGPVVIADAEGRRLNDGKPDPTGRYLVGTLRLDGPSTTEELLMVGGEGVTTLDRDLTLSNGLGWSADGRVMYSIDTLRRTVFRRRWLPGVGPDGEREVFLVADGHPDGMCLDAHDHLWIAMWGLGQVHRYTPDGRLVDVVDVPAPHTSSVAFAGPDLRTLVITTSVQDLDPEQLERFPLSGHLFTVRPGVAGAPQALWSGVL